LQEYRMGQPFGIWVRLTFPFRDRGDALSRFFQA
jgi:hypothetical protein